MEHRDAFLLESIVDFCDRLMGVLSDEGVTRENFLRNLKLQDLCSFYCLQIGEYAGSLSDSFKNNHLEIEWREIVALRHIIAHAYGSIDAGVLWDICSNDISKLRDFCIKYIK